MSTIRCGRFPLREGKVRLPFRALVLTAARTVMLVSLVSPFSLAGVQDSNSKAADKPSQAAPAPAARAGTTDSTSSKPIRVQVGEVSIAVTVLDKRGLPVIGLNKEDFQVYEDGQLQTIRYFGKEPPLPMRIRSEEHTSELQSLAYLVCRLLLEKKKKKKIAELRV